MEVLAADRRPRDITTLARERDRGGRDVGRLHQLVLHLLAMAHEAGVELTRGLRPDRRGRRCCAT